MFPSAADLNHFKHFFLRFLKGVVVEERGFVFLGEKKKKRKKRKEKKEAHTHSITILFPTLLEYVLVGASSPSSSSSPPPRRREKTKTNKTTTTTDWEK